MVTVARNAPSAPARQMLPQADCNMPSDAFKHAAEQVWKDTVGRRNVQSNTVNLECDLVSVTRQRIQYTEMLRALGTLHTKLGEVLAEREVAALLAPTGSLSWEKLDEDEEQVLGDHEGLNMLVELVGMGERWRKLRADTNNGIVSNTIKLVRAAMDPEEGVVAQARAIKTSLADLTRVENLLYDQMYPSTLEHMYTILRTHGAVPQDGYEMPTVPCLAEETCWLCRDNDIDQPYACVTPRCKQHTLCIQSRQGGKACKCKSKYAHLDCLTRQMFQSYKNGRRDGMTPVQPVCSLCRGEFCYNDIMCLRVVRPPKRDADAASLSESITAAKRTRSAVPAVKKVVVVE